MVRRKKVARKVRSVDDRVLNDKFKITKVIHNGGMSNVYQVVDDKDLPEGEVPMTWCIKEVLVGDTAAEKLEEEAILREAQIMKNLGHSGIVRIVEIEKELDEDGGVYAHLIRMDFINGKTLQSLLVARRRFSQAETVKWIIQACSIIGYLHGLKKPVMYLDMKPTNIMLKSDGNIVLLDFGISQVITETNHEIRVGLGTKGFAAPEQGKVGTPLSPTMDIHALGATMFTMLTGVLPTNIENRNFSIRNQISGLSIGLDKIIVTCTQADPRNRYQTVEELMYHLQTFNSLDDRYIAKAKRKIHTTVTVGIVGALMMVGCAVPFVLDQGQKKDQYAESVQAAEQSGRVADYNKAIALSPGNIGPYEGMIESIKTDGVFDKEEEKALLNLVNPSLNTLQKSPEYGELAYNIGRTYWFYYVGEGESGAILSTKWFNDAVTYNAADKDKAEVLFNLGRFDKRISSAIQESQDGGMYKDYWNDLQKATEISNGEIIDIQLYDSMALAIKNYAPRLKTDGVTKAELEKGIQTIQARIDSVPPSAGRPVELMEKLKTDSVGLQRVLDAAYQTVLEEGN